MEICEQKNFRKRYWFRISKKKQHSIWITTTAEESLVAEIIFFLEPF